MSIKGFKSHPYIPNSVKEVQDAMLKELGLNSLEDLHAEIPSELKLKESLDIPEAFGSEYELRRHVEELLAKNKNCKNYINFLGAGCFQHYVPAICDEINGRGEFLTAYGGESYNDFGRFQALFEYQSLVAELVDMEVVNVPTIDFAQAAATAMKMAARITGRQDVLIPELISEEKFLVIKNYCSPHVNLIKVGYIKETGLLDLDDLKSKISDKTAAIYFQNPSYLGIIETNGQLISDIAHKNGSISIVGVDPISLGVLAPPVEYGADIVCGELQPLGMHMNYGGGQAGFIATMDDEKFVMEFPSRIFGIAPTIVEGEYGFGDVAYDRTSFGHHREHAKEYVGTQTALWGITAGVYLATMGPKGMEEVAGSIMQKSKYAMLETSNIKNVECLFNSPFFKEFVLDFNKTGKTVKEINKMLLSKGIFGGLDLSSEFKALGQSALYCVTEMHTKNDIDKLVSALKEIVAN